MNAGTRCPVCFMPPGQCLTYAQRMALKDAATIIAKAGRNP